MKVNFSLLYDIPWILLCLFIYFISILAFDVIKKEEMEAIERAGIMLPRFLYKIAR